MSLPNIALTDEPHTPAQPVILCFVRETQRPFFAVTCSKVCSPKFFTLHTSGMSSVGTVIKKDGYNHSFADSYTANVENGCTIVGNKYLPQSGQHLFLFS